MDRFTSGGFDFLDLGFKYFKDASPIPYGGNLEFLESVSINAKGAVRLAGGGVIRSTFPVSVSAPYVAIGQEFLAPLNPADPYQPFREFNAGTHQGNLKHQVHLGRRYPGQRHRQRCRQALFPSRPAVSYHWLSV
jgi:hypothetical protein